MKQILNHFLILFFTLLIIYQLITNMNIVEGFEDVATGTLGAVGASTGTAIGTATGTVGTYQSYGSDDIATLAHKNAGNIEVLKGQMDKIMSFVPSAKEALDKFTQDISTLQTQVNALAQAQTKQVTKVTNPTPTITGTTT